MPEQLQVCRPRQQSLPHHGARHPLRRNRRLLLQVRAPQRTPFPLSQLFNSRGAIPSEREKALLTKLVVTNQLPVVYRKSLWLLLTAARKRIAEQPRYYLRLLRAYPDFLYYRHIQLVSPPPS